MNVYFREPPCKSEAFAQVNRLNLSNNTPSAAFFREIAALHAPVGPGLGWGSDSCHKSPMTVSLRPHHLLCMLTYLGKGYTADFISNYNQIVKRLNKGEPIRLVGGPDDICQPMLQEASCHCHTGNVRERDRLAAAEIGKVLGCSLETGSGLRLTGGQLAVLRRAFLEGSIRSGCAGCEWQELCTGIARNGFRGCRLASPD